ncbi:hypothetical protein BRADI_3g10874v3 [Brachypodium distachyon]|uniref:Reverse transcriptase zinc-binding domain-containing protein n=1 Tax=Brachypodium distachyon TaxID=15368 RepID=A0A2K2CWH8_BRADI|nr:hypothetical protein BRADI_3g10874v3 [Brachypodium distachyon]
MPHQADETISHLLLGCQVARQVWWKALSAWGRPDWLKGPDASLCDWWPSVPLAMTDRRDFATVSILLLWCLWKYRNRVVFDHIPVHFGALVKEMGSEMEAWLRAGLLRRLAFSVIPREWRDSG